MDNEVYYKVEENELKALIEDALTLRALQLGGVDNWVWYEESIRRLVDIWELEKIDLEPNEEKEMEHLVREVLLEYDVLEDRQ